MKTNHILAVINAAAQNGFEFDPSDTMEEIWQQAEETLLENEPMGHQFIQCDLNGHGMSQGYTFIDEDGTDITMSGEIFTFHKAKEEDDVYEERRRVHPRELVRHSRRVRQQPKKLCLCVRQSGMLRRHHRLPLRPHGINRGKPLI